jgi:uncharacterized membrane protein
MMSPLELLMLLSRWLHILAAITAVGGTIFARTVVMPAQSVLSADQQQALHKAMRIRWSKIVAASIGFLLLSGLFNFIMTVHDYTVPRWYHMLFGAKFLLAMGIFLIASLLSGKTAAAERLRTQARLWMNVNIVLAVVLVCISGVLRTADKKPRVQTAAPAPESRQPA